MPINESRPVDKKKDCWDKIQIIGSVLVTPLVIAVFGWLIQSSIADQTVSKDYVELAISIITSPEDDIDPAIRDWAFDLLSENSPTKFKSDVLESLKTGDLELPLYLPGATTLFGTRVGEGWLSASGFCIYMDAPEPEITFDPEPPTRWGETVAISIHYEWEDCAYEYRLRLDGTTLLESSKPDDSYSLGSEKYTPGAHILKIEIRPIGAFDWRTSWESIYVLEE